MGHQVDEAALVAMESSGDDGEMVEAAQPARRSWTSRAAFASLGLLLGSAALLCAHRLLSPSADTAPVQQDFISEAAVGSGQYRWQIIPKERDLCSKPKHDCETTGCCSVSGFYCYDRINGPAKCMKECKPVADGDCIPRSQPLELLPASEGVPATSLYCFSVYTKNTGSTKKSYEKELLALQFKKKASIFACNAYAVYSDVAVTVAPGLTTNKVEDVNGEFHFAKRKETGAWVNSGLFIQVWKAVSAAGTYGANDWVIKVDPDAVFKPQVLVDRIKLMPRTNAGVILQNCKGVEYGFFGSLEVFSKRAFETLVVNIDSCKAKLPWKVGIKGGKYGPMGEDLFAEICMEKNGVDKIEAFDIVVDGACPMDRPKDQRKNKKWKANCGPTSAAAMHPFKKPADYSKCLAATL